MLQREATGMWLPLLRSHGVGAVKTPQNTRAIGINCVRAATTPRVGKRKHPVSREQGELFSLRLNVPTPPAKNLGTAAACAATTQRPLVLHP